MASFEGSEPEAASLGFFENRHLLSQTSRGLVVLNALEAGACAWGYVLKTRFCILPSLNSSGEKTQADTGVSSSAPWWF